MTDDDAVPLRPARWRTALAAVLGRPGTTDHQAFGIAGAVCLGAVPLAAVDSLTAGAAVLTVVVLGVAVVVVLFSIVALVTAHGRLEDEPAATGDGDGDGEAVLRRHGTVVLWALAALLYGVEASAAFSSLVLGGDALGSARRFFLWHVADTVPVFTVTDTFDLPQPALALGVAGVVALVLKVALILPLIRIAVAAFRVCDGSGGTAARAGFRIFTPRRARDGADFPFWRSALRAMVVVVFSGAFLTTMLTICNWVGPLSARLAATLPGRAGRLARASGDVALGVLGSLAVQATLLTFLAVVLVATTWWILHGLLRADLGSLSRVTIGLAILAASLMSLLLVFSTAAAVDLLVTCLVEGRAPMIEAAGRLEWFAWHSMDVVPEWSVPGVLRWPQPAGPGSWWSGVLLVLAKVVAVLVIAVPVARVGRAARRTWPDMITRTTAAR